MRYVVTCSTCGETMHRGVGFSATWVSPHHCCPSEGVQIEWIYNPEHLVMWSKTQAKLEES